jgi:dihydrofolate reductase
MSGTGVVGSAADRAALPAGESRGGLLGLPVAGRRAMSRILARLRHLGEQLLRGAAQRLKDTEMRKLIAIEWMSLDGVVQAPSYPDEDRSGGFDRGGWHARYFDDVSMSWVVETVQGAGGYLLGRGTYDIFAAHWPNASEAEQVLAGPLNMRPKYVASTTLVEPLEWQGSTLLRGDIGDAVPAPKAQDGDDLLVIGSPGLVQSLLAHDLLDEVRAMIDPLVVGAGKRLFGDGNPIRALRLVESQVTRSGAIIATYAVTR